MRLDRVTAEIRPRSDWEAVDLGFALVRRDFWRCLAIWWLAMAVPLGAATLLLWRHPLLLTFLFWWFKPVGSRLVLFQLSRHLFGEQPAWKSLWREIPKAWLRRFGYRFLWARISPWQPLTLAVEELEGLRGKSYQMRSSQLGRRGGGAVLWIYFLADVAALWLALGIFGVAMMFIPDGQGSLWSEAMESWDRENPLQIPLVITWTAAGCLMVAGSLTDLFVTGAGFGIYLNNRTWLEGWDVELAFKRLAQRLSPVALVAFAICLSGLAGSAHGQELDPTPAEVIREVKADKDFTVHRVTTRVPKPRNTARNSSPFQVSPMVMNVIGMGAAGVVIGALGWVLWKCRHVFAMRGGGEKQSLPVPAVRVVMGMDVSPASLPDDIPAAVWGLWQQGQAQAAMGLLYRGAISRVMAVGRVEIQESDTEGDCLRRVDEAGHRAHPEYFRGITGAWIRMAYAGIRPAKHEVEALCRQWPFGGGGER